MCLIVFCRIFGAAFKATGGEQVQRVPVAGCALGGLLYAGGLSESRGSDCLLAAIPNMPQGWRAVSAGSGPLAGRCLRLAAGQPKRSEFLGLITPEVPHQRFVELDLVINGREQLRREEGVFPFKVLD